MTDPFTALTAADPELADIVRREIQRQNTTIQLIASENFTSLAVSARPLWNFTPLRSLNVHCLPSALVVHDSASTGRILRSRSKSTSPW